MEIIDTLYIYIYYMKGKVNKWGSSLGVRIPRKLADDAGIREGSAVDITLQDGALTIRKPKYSLKELLAGITPENRHPKIEWGPPLSNELW